MTAARRKRRVHNQESLTKYWLTGFDLSERKVSGTILKNWRAEPAKMIAPIRMALLAGEECNTRWITFLVKVLGLVAGEMSLPPGAKGALTATVVMLLMQTVLTATARTRKVRCVPKRRCVFSGRGPRNIKGEPVSN